MTSIAPQVSRHRSFAVVDGRKVHYRRWGSGPVVLAIHGSPQSSRAMALLGDSLANAGLCVIAPDNPGSGLSEPLNRGDKSSVVDFADAIVKFADAIGLNRFGIYGFHTGAAFGCVIAARYPKRVSALACDGLPNWTRQERQQLLQGYLPPFTPTWDGAHMAWLWARLEEQTVFFPWHSGTESNRMDFDVSSPEQVHANAMDFLESGDNYRIPYRAAFEFDAKDWLPKVASPTMITAFKRDPLQSHFDRALFTQYEPQAFDDIDSMYRAIESFFSSNNAESINDHIEQDSSGIISGWVGEEDQALAWSGALNGDSRPLILLHGAGDSKSIFEDCLATIAQHRPVISFDLPGHGDSDRLSETDAPKSVEEIAKMLDSACKRLGLTEYCAAGIHLGGQVAAYLVNSGLAKYGAAIGLNSIAQQDDETWAEDYAPALTPVWDGSHLLKAYRIARWEKLFFPWFKRDRKHAIDALTQLAPETVQQRAVNLLRSANVWKAAVTAEANYPLSKNLPPENTFQLFSLCNDPRSFSAKSWHIHVTQLSQKPDGWTEILKNLGL